VMWQFRRQSPKPSINEAVNCNPQPVDKPLR
jgi:hypothetical protein